MPNCEPLFWFGLFVLCLTSGLIVVPYVRRKAELLSAWNMLLVGIAVFMGFGSLEAAYSPVRFGGLDWYESTSQEVATYLLYSITFLACLLLCYYYEPISKGVAARSFNTWPPITTGCILCVLALCLVLSFAVRVQPLLRIPFVGAVVVNLSHKAFVFACVFSFILWYRQRLNAIWLGVFVSVFLAMCVLAIVASGGRRLLMSVVLVPVLVIYYYDARSWKPTKCLAAIGVAATCVLIVGIVYASFRHFDRRGDKTDRSASAVVGSVASTNVSGAIERFTSDVLFQFGQQNAHYAMLIDHLIDTDRLESKPFNTFTFLTTYPIPRQFWRGKPVTLGRVVGTDVVPMFARNQGVRWGCGIAGQAAYEGGLIVIPFYAILATFCVRLIDDPLRRQPTNPFLIAMLGAASFHLVAWPRGDLGVLSIEVIECFLFTFALSLGCRLIFGLDRSAIRSVGARVPGYYGPPVQKLKIE